MDIKSLDRAGYVPFDYPLPLRDAVRAARDSWTAFCTLPQDEKSLFEGGDRIKDFGYMYRNDKGPKSDHKEQFHASRFDFPRLLPIAKKIGDKRAVEFIEAIDHLIVRMEPIVITFAREVEGRYKIAGFEHLVQQSLNYWIFRYLHYFPGKPVLAMSHADRGGMTFHLDESDAGGEYFDLEKRLWLPWPVSEKQTIIFPSMGLQFISRCALKALWHQVVCNDRTIANGRYSIVAFVDFQFSHRFDDSKYRMQDFEPGFNYDMPFAEFDKFFMPRKELAPG